MLVSQIRDLYEYNTWVNHLMMDKAAELDPAQLHADSRFPRGSFLGTLFHTFYAEWIWRKRLQGSEHLPPEQMIKANDYGELAVLRNAWLDEEAGWAHFLAGLNEGSLSASISYRSTSGSFSNRVGDILLHVILHGVQHRAELAQMLTEFGHSPGDIDYIIYRRNLGK